MKPQIIYENERPAFVVLPYQDYMKLAAEDEELIPFELTNYIADPIKAARIEAGLTTGRTGRTHECKPSLHWQDRSVSIQAL